MEAGMSSRAEFALAMQTPQSATQAIMSHESRLQTQVQTASVDDIESTSRLRERESID